MALFPTDINYSASKLSLFDNVTAEITQNGRHNAVKHGASRYSFTISVPILTETNWRKLLAFVAEQDGAYTPFTIRHPLLKDISGEETGSVTLSGSWSKGDQTIIMDCTASITPFYKGDMINIAGSNQVYTVLSQEASDGAGFCNVKLYPPLRFTPAANAAVTINNVEFTVYAPGGIPNFDFTPPDFGKTSFTVVEVLS